MDITSRRLFGALATPLLIVALSPLLPFVAHSEVLTIGADKPSTVRSLLEGPANSRGQIKANLILLVGGNGVLRLSKSGTFQKKHNNFVARSRHLLQAKGYLTALVDAPLGKHNKNGLKGFRSQKQHASDLAQIAQRLKAGNNRPVIVIGTSRGSISAANLAAHDKVRLVDGVILSSSLLVGANHTSLNGVAVTKIRVPVLVVHHKKDGCKKTPFAAAKNFTKKLQAADLNATFVPFTGGHSKSAPCRGRSYHGFYGIETKVIKAMSAWIEQQVLSP